MARKNLDQKRSFSLTKEQQQLFEDAADKEGIHVAELIRRGALMYVKKFTPELFKNYEGK